MHCHMNIVHNIEAHGATPDTVMGHSTFGGFLAHTDELTYVDTSGLLMLY